jgi:hypothetical protein
MPFLKPFGADAIRFMNVPPGIYENIEIHFLLAGIMDGTLRDAKGAAVSDREVIAQPGGGLLPVNSKGEFHTELPPIDNVVMEVRNPQTQRVVYTTEPFRVAEGQIIRREIIVRDEEK